MVITRPARASITGAMPQRRRWGRMNNMIFRGSFLLLVSFLLGATASLYSDSFPKPERREYLSENEKFRFTVQPPLLSSVRAYHYLRTEEYMVLALEEPDPKNMQLHSEGILEQRTESGDYRVLWKRLLVNRIAPAHVMVCDSRGFVVTFDDWAEIGTSKNTVVIYGPGGIHVRSLSLGGLLSPDEIQQLPRSVSTIFWAGGHRFSEDCSSIILEIGERGTYRQFAVELASGRIAEEQGPTNRRSQ